MSSGRILDDDDDDDDDAECVMQFNSKQGNLYPHTFLCI